MSSLRLSVGAPPFRDPLGIVPQDYSTPELLQGTTAREAAKRNKANKTIAVDKDTPSTGLEHYFSSPLVKLVVGDDRKLLYAHRDLLMARSSYFAAALSPYRFKESCILELNLLEDKPLVIGLLLRWLYAGPGTLHSMAICPDNARHFFRLYLAADKFCVEGVKNETLDVLRRVSLVHGSLSAQIAWVMYQNTVPGDKMRLWLVRQYAYDHANFIGRDMTTMVGAEGSGFGELLEHVTKGGDFAVDVLRAFIERGGTGRILNPASDEDCIYHEHRFTDKCRPTVCWKERFGREWRNIRGTRLVTRPARQG